MGKEELLLQLKTKTSLSHVLSAHPVLCCHVALPACPSSVPTLTALERLYDACCLLLVITMEMEMVASSRAFTDS